MKKLILTTSLVALVAASSFAQGSVSFKNTGTKNSVYSATDNTSASLALIPTTDIVGSFGAVTYEVFSAPTGTAAPTVVNKQLVFSGLWTGTVVSGSPYAYASPGVVSPGIEVDLPSSSGAGGSAVELEIVAFTGSLNNPGLYGYSGMALLGTVTTGGNAALEWTNGTGAPDASPVTAPAALLTGTAAYGSIILEPIPEPSTIALGGLAAASLLAFRRKK